MCPGRLGVRPSRIRSARPGRASLRVPSAITAVPLTNTQGMPAACRRGWSNVAGVGHRLGVEQHQIGVVALPDQTPAVQAQPGRGPSGEVVDAVGQLENAELAHVVPEVAREGAPGPWVRLGTRQDRVRAAAVRAVPHDRADVLLVPDVLQDRGAQPVAEQQVEAHLRRRGAGPFRQRRDSAADRARQVRVAHPADLDRGPVGDTAVAAVAADLLQLEPDPFSGRGIGELGQLRVRAAGRGPARPSETSVVAPGRYG